MNHETYQLRLCNKCKILYWEKTSVKYLGECVACAFVTEKDVQCTKRPLSLDCNSTSAKAKSIKCINSIREDWLIYDEVDDGFKDDKCLYCNISFTSCMEIKDREMHIRKCMSNMVTHSAIEDASFPCVLCGRELSCLDLLSRFSHLGKCASAHGVEVQHLLQILHPELDSADMSISPTHDMSDNLQSESSSKNDLSVDNRNTNWALIMPTSHHSMTKNKKQRFKGARSWDKGPRGGRPPAYKLIHGAGLTEPIMVDGFHYADSSITKTYILTHFHSDHYGGITKKFSAGQIYCSGTTAGLLQLHFGMSSSLITSLSFDFPHKIASPGGDFEVLLLDANHCPGAACFLFTFSDGRQVLHTGDFRWSSSCLLRSPGWAKLADQTRALPDHQFSACSVYLDTTYCDPKHTFPSQDLAIQAVIEAVRDELEVAKINGFRPLFVFGAYGIGKERVYMAVAEALDRRVYVDPSRRRAMSHYCWTEDRLARLVTDPTKSDLWVAPLGQVNFKSLTSMRSKIGGYTQVVAFQPTGWSYTRSGSGESLLSKKMSGQDCIYSVPYSEHSSFSELVDFVRLFRPQLVIPTVNTAKDKVTQQLSYLRNASGIYSKKTPFSPTAAATVTEETETVR